LSLAVTLRNLFYNSQRIAGGEEEPVFPLSVVVVE
jgi:hypothetical protein